MKITNIINSKQFTGKTKRRDSKKKAEPSESLHREQNLLTGGRLVDNQAKWRKLGYKGGEAVAVPAGQTAKKTTAVTGATTEVPTTTPTSGNDLNAVKRVGELRRTSDGDIVSGRVAGEKASAAALNTRQPEPNGVRKDLVSQEKRRRLSLVDEKELHITGN